MMRIKNAATVNTRKPKYQGKNTKLKMDKFGEFVTYDVKIPAGFEKLATVRRRDGDLQAYGALIRNERTGVIVFWDGCACRGINQTDAKDFLKANGVEVK